jgi:hypothetical protein
MNTPRKPGRPRKPASEKKRTFTVRLPVFLRDRLLKRAAVTKRTLSAEVEIALTRYLNEYELGPD